MQIEEEPPSLRPLLPLDRMGIAGLHAHIGRLRAEIIRAEAEIVRKGTLRNAADSVFRTT